MFEEKYNEYQNAIDKALQDMVDYLQEEYECLNDDDCIEIIEEHGHDIGDIKAAYTSIDDAASAEAFSLGFVTNESEKYFNWDAFIDDLKENDNYIVLSSGAVVYVNR